MPKLTILFILLLSNSTLLAGVDSLLSLQKFPSDEKKVEYLLELCFDNRSVNIALALESGHKAYGLSKKINNTHYIARSCNMLSVVYRGLWNFEKALAYAIQAVKVSEKSEDHVQLGFGNNNIGHVFRLKGYFDRALHHSLTAYFNFKSQNHLEGMAYSAINLGWIQIWMKNPKGGIPYFQESSEIRNQMGDVSGAAASDYGLANAYAGIREFHTALNIYNNLLSGYDSSQINSINKGMIYYSIAKVYHETKLFDLALENYKRAFTESKLIGNLGDSFIYAVPIINLSDSLNRHSDAKKIISEMLPLIDNAKNLTDLAEFYKALQNHYYFLGNLEQAYIYSNLRSSINDSITLQVKAESIESMALVFDNFRVYEENQELQTTIISRSSGLLYGSMLIIALISVIIFLIIKNRRMKSKKSQSVAVTISVIISLIYYTL